MPMYSFQCNDDLCGEILEAFRPMSVTEKDYPLCTTCGTAMRRILSGPCRFSLKGTGWAQDGYTCTDRGATEVSTKADRKGKIVSYPNQKVRGR